MRKSWLFIILLFFLLFSLFSLPRNPLQNDDASLYALAAKNAILHHQWLAQFVTPGDPSSFMDKPPLGIWLLAWLPNLIGINQLTIHIPNVLYYLLTLLLLFYFLNRLAGRQIAFASTLIASTSLCLVVYSRSPKLDILLTLFVMIANYSFWLFICENKNKYLVWFTLALAAGFLTKSGFGLLFPGLTALTLIIINPEARRTSIRFIFSLPGLGCLTLLLAIIGGILSLQALALGPQWSPYLKAITIQSKYNTSYLGLGYYTSTLGFLLVTIFPWTPLFLTSLFKKNINNSPHLSVGNQKITLSNLCSVWFWSNFLFLFFFYRQNDLRTFTVLVPPLATLAGLRLAELQSNPTIVGKPERSWSEIAWSFFFVVVFSFILIALIINPHNQQGFDISSALIPVSFFVVALILVSAYLIFSSPQILIVTFLSIVISYSVLFFYTLPLANALNPDLEWPNIISQYKIEGYKFYIYRPPDRPLFYSPDLFYVDFMAGPADRYFWQKDELISALAKKKAILLSDTKSWKKLNLQGNIVAQDNYSELIIYP